MSDNFDPFSFNNTSTNLDIELLKREVGQRFPFYDLRYNLNTAVFFCRVDKETLEEKFNDLHNSLKEKGYIPILRSEKGEYLIYITRKLESREKPVWINVALLIATFFTTILTGSLISMGHLSLFDVQNLEDVFRIENLINGTLLFAIPLMSILFVHEMGHYFISRKHNVSTSLPYFLPVPPILPGFNIGTFGALISSREPIPNKRALFDVGFAGPLAGFLVALPVTAIGIATASVTEIPKEVPPGTIVYSSSLLIELLSKAILNLPEGFTINMNPLLFAGWVGLLVTSINLLPAGQLDGGHIFRAVLGEKQKYVGWAAVFIMILTGWIFFALIIIFLMGVWHPPPLNDDTEIDKKRKLLFIVAVIILLLCYIPYPFYIA